MGSRSLLVVDDSATFRQLLCLSLQRVDGISKGDIIEASDGADALEKVKRHSLILCLPTYGCRGWTGWNSSEK